ncbi:MAG: flavobacterium repeat protein [Bacteroidetes bacterium]|nr:flavobacterium repeat protein [Bacteroidota bacterium]
MKRLLLVWVSIIIVLSFKASAEDFSSVYQGQTIYYNITSMSSPYSVEVTYKGDFPTASFNEYSGDLVIPPTVIYDDKTYNINSIGEMAFTYCDSLTSISIPATINSIIASSFYIIPSLVSINVDSNNMYYSSLDGVLYNKAQDTLLRCPESYSRSSFTIPSSVNIVGANAFEFCKGLTSVSIPNSVTRIEKHAFCLCIGLTSISIPESVNFIGDCAFNYCTNLTSINCAAVIPPTIESSDIFLDVPMNIPVNVPCSSIESYRNAQYWSRFSNITCFTSLLDRFDNKLSAKLYPNPAINKTIIEIQGLENKAEVIITDLFGRMMSKYNINESQSLEINLESFTKGTYNVSIQTNNRAITKKLIVQ